VPNIVLNIITGIIYKLYTEACMKNVVFLLDLVSNFIGQKSTTGLYQKLCLFSRNTPFIELNILKCDSSTANYAEKCIFSHVTRNSSLLSHKFIKIMK